MSSLSNHKTLEEAVTGRLSVTLAESFPGLGQDPSLVLAELFEKQRSRRAWLAPRLWSASY